MKARSVMLRAFTKRLEDGTVVRRAGDGLRDAAVVLRGRRSP